MTSELRNLEFVVIDESPSGENPISILASDVRQRKRIQQNLSEVKEDHRGPKTSLKLMQRQQDRHFLVMEGEAEAEEDVKNVEVEVEGEEEQGVKGLK